MEIISKLYFPQNRFLHQMTEMLFKMGKKNVKIERGRSLITTMLKPVRKLSRQLVDNLFLVLFTRLPVCVTWPVWRGKKENICHI